MTAGTSKKFVYVLPHTWLGRLVTAIVTVVLIALAVLFFAVFLAAFAVLAVVVIARILWAQRQSRRQAAEHVIDVKYSVEQIEKKPHGGTRASKSQPQKLGDRQCGDKRP